MPILLSKWDELLELFFVGYDDGWEFIYEYSTLSILFKL